MRAHADTNDRNLDDGITTQHLAGAQLGLEARPGARAWDLPKPLNPASLDLPRYKKLLIRAASAVLQPLGVDEAQLTARLLGGVAQELDLGGSVRRLEFP